MNPPAGQGRIITPTGAIRWPWTIALIVFVSLIALVGGLITQQVREGRQERQELQARQQEDSAVLCRAILSSNDAMRQILASFSTSEVPLPDEAPGWFLEYVEQVRESRVDPTVQIERILAPPPECTASGPRLR